MSFWERRRNSRDEVFRSGTLVSDFLSKAKARANVTGSHEHRELHTGGHGPLSIRQPSRDIPRDPW